MDVDDLSHIQRLKAAVHYTVGKICEEVSEEKGMQFSKQFIAVLAETTYKTAQSMATDLELFAKHAKRSTVNPDDVKLFVRKSPGLHQYIAELAETQATENEEKRKAKQKKSKASVAAVNNTTEDNT